MSSIPVKVSGVVHYVSRVRAAWSALSGRPARTRCGHVLMSQHQAPAGELCRPCAVRAGERTL